LREIQRRATLTRGSATRGRSSVRKPPENNPPKAGADTHRSWVVTGCPGRGNPPPPRRLEDLGFFCIRQPLPVMLLPKMLGSWSARHQATRCRRLGLVARSAGGAVHRLKTRRPEEVPERRATKAGGWFSSICARRTRLMRRFSETRGADPLRDPPRGSVAGRNRPGTTACSRSFCAHSPIRSSTQRA